MMLYAFRMTGSLDTVYRPEFLTREHKFRNLDLFSSSGEWGDTYSVGPFRKS
jgi:hypothetical protein